MAVLDSTRRSETTLWRRAAVLAGLIPLAGLIVVFAALRDHTVVFNRRGLSKTSFGWPMDWLIQDQRTFSPPYPFEFSPASPWENPTTTRLDGFVVDFLLVYAVLLAVFVAALWAYRRLRSAARATSN